ncbi:hypothetical protein ACP4OV_018975 [Aristida adscensionis]
MPVTTMNWVNEIASLSPPRRFRAYQEMRSPVAAQRLFRAAVVEWHALAPEIASHTFASAELVEGGGGETPETFRLYNFTAGTEKIGQQAGGTSAFSRATSDIKMEPTAGGGTKITVDSTYTLLPGVKASYEIKKATSFNASIFEVVEAYLMHNPDAYGN